MAGKGKKDPVLSASPISVEIGGETYVLEPTIRAVREICAVCDGLGPAFRAVRAINIPIMGAVVLAGSGTKLKDADALDAFETALLAGDVTQIGGACGDYLTLLLSGGIPARGEVSGSGKA